MSLRKPKAANQNRDTGHAKAFLRRHMRNMAGHETAAACGCPLKAFCAIKNSMRPFAQPTQRYTTMKLVKVMAGEVA